MLLNEKSEKVENMSLLTVMFEFEFWMLTGTHTQKILNLTETRSERQTGLKIRPFFFCPGMLSKKEHTLYSRPRCHVF
jgi:hypothetical protein